MHDTVNSKFRFLSQYKIVCSGLLTLVLIAGLTACSTKKLNEINLMPAPDVYEKGAVDPFTDTNPIEKIPYNGILQATDRSPAGENDHFYNNKRGNLLHDLRPDERGLVQSEDIPIWTFPPDYIQRLRAALLEVSPDAKKNLE